jgi:hypothetical protein
LITVETACHAPVMSDGRFSPLEAVFGGAHCGVGAVSLTILFGRPCSNTPRAHPVTGSGVFDFIKNDPADFAAQHIVITVVLGSAPKRISDRPEP